MFERLAASRGGASNAALVNGDAALVQGNTALVHGDAAVKDGVLDWSALAYWAMQRDVQENAHFDAEEDDDED